MSNRKGKPPARIVQFLLLVVVFLLVAAVSTGYSLGKGDLSGQPGSGQTPPGLVEESGSGFSSGPGTTASAALLFSELDGQAPADLAPSAGPLPSHNPDPTPAPQPAPSPSARATPTPAPQPAAVPSSVPSSKETATVSGEPSSASAGTAAIAAPATPPPAAVSPFTLGQGISRNLRMRVVVANNGGDESRDIRIEVPLLGKLSSPYQVILKETFSHTPADIATVAQGSRIGYFHFSSIAPGSTVTLVVDYSLRVHPFTAHFAAYRARPAAGPAGFLQPSANIESDHPQIVARAAEVTSGKNGDLEKARAIYAFVQRHLRYDPGSPYRNRGALSALETATGVCEEYAALFTALCRAAGIPARQVNGYTDPRGTGDIFNSAISLRGYRHSWAEFYLEGMGWLPADPTMNIGADSFKYFGSLPRASHIAQNYLDQSMRVTFSGGQLSVAWEESLIK